MKSRLRETDKEMSLHPKARESVRVRIIRAFTERLALKATAIGLSIILWFIITVKEPTGEWVVARFEPMLDSSLALQGKLPEIDVFVFGAPAEVAKLRRRPPVVRPTIGADTPDTVVISLKQTDVRVPEGIRVDRIDPSSVTLQFEPTWTRRVPVRADIRAAIAGGEVASSAVIIEPDVVEIWGPRLDVLKTMLVVTEPVTMSPTDSLAHLVMIDTTDLKVRAKPAQVTVRLRNAADTTLARRR